MAFFDNFKLVRTKTGYAVKYKGETLARFNPKTFASIIKDHATKNLLKELTSMVEITDVDASLTVKAKQLEKLYTARRKKFYRNKNLKHITEKSSDFKHFVKAIEIINSHKVSYKQFLDAQIKGLAFVNDGKGVFPKPSQLSSAGAEERLLNSMQEYESENNEEVIVRRKLTYSDKETPLMENPSFVAAFNKIRNGNATLKDAYFVYDCMLYRNGKVTKMVREYVENLEG